MFCIPRNLSEFWSTQFIHSSIERPYSSGPQAVGAVYDRPGFLVQSMRLVPLVFVALIYLALRYSVLGSLGIPVSAQYMGGRLTYFERLLTSGRVFIQYLILMFYPLNLAGDY